MKRACSLSHPTSRGHAAFHTRHQEGMQPFTPDIKSMQPFTPDIKKAQNLSYTTSRACNLSHPTSRGARSLSHPTSIEHANFHTRHQEGMQPFTPDIKRAYNLSHRHQEGMQPFTPDIKMAYNLSHRHQVGYACSRTSWDTCVHPARSSLLNVIEETQIRRYSPDNCY